MAKKKIVILPKTKKILNESGNLWIAKFLSRNNKGDVGGWEIVTYEMAIYAGINMAESMARKYSSDHYTFLTKRFDRTATGERLHFASVMTMLGCSQFKKTKGMTRNKLDKFYL